MAVTGESDIMETITLRNGVRMPMPGYGTYKLPDDPSASEAVADAIRCGYRHIDCAAFYKNEKSVGDGIRDGLRTCGLRRDDIFVTGKVWVSDRSYEGTFRSFRRSIEDLGLDYFDLLLIHWPADIHEREDWEQINLDTWRAFYALYGKGLVRAIGRNDLSREILLAGNLLMVEQIVGRIIGSPHCIDLHFLHDAADRKGRIFLELSVGFFIYGFGILSVQDLGYAEIALKLKMRPMV